MDLLSRINEILDQNQSTAATGGLIPVNNMGDGAPQPGYAPDFALPPSRSILNPQQVAPPVGIGQDVLLNPSASVPPPTNVTINPSNHVAQPQLGYNPNFTLPPNAAIPPSFNNSNPASGGLGKNVLQNSSKPIGPMSALPFVEGGGTSALATLASTPVNPAWLLGAIPDVAYAGGKIGEAIYNKELETTVPSGKEYERYDKSTIGGSKAAVDAQTKAYRQYDPAYQKRQQQSNLKIFMGDDVTANMMTQNKIPLMAKNRYEQLTNQVKQLADNFTDPDKVIKAVNSSKNIMSDKEKMAYIQSYAKDRGNKGKFLIEYDGKNYNVLNFDTVEEKRNYKDIGYADRKHMQRINQGFKGNISTQTEASKQATKDYAKMPAAEQNKMKKTYSKTANDITKGLIDISKSTMGFK